MTLRLTLLPILYGSGLKLVGRSKPVMHGSAPITKIEGAMVSPLKLVAIK